MPNDPNQAGPSASNRVLLDEVNASGRWFRARKIQAIWARQLEEPQTVMTLEGEEQVGAGQFLCKGAAGDVWPQTEQDLLRKYQPTGDTTADSWKKYAPRPDAEGVMAAQIEHAFEVHAVWGRLAGKPGDFLLKNFADRDRPYPEDVWVVDRKLFRDTYAPADSQCTPRNNRGT